MLVLRRKEGEEIVIRTSDGDVTVAIVRLTPERGEGNGRRARAVHIGFDAPQSIIIVRKEIA